MVFVTNDVEYNYINKVIEFRRVHIPVHIVRNGISSSRFKFIREIPDNRDSTHPVLLYVGNVGIAQNLTTIVEIADQFPSLRIFIIGEGRDLGRVKSYSEARLIDNITFVGGVPWVDLMDYYSRASILYAQIADAYASAIPSKLYEYLTVGVPVIYGGQGVAADFLAEFEFVKVVEPENPKALSAAIQNILTDISISRNKNNPELIRKKYIREVQVSSVVHLILGLCENAKKTV
jgi:glycosyltransferase involved in cell wall biosynthesis